MPLAPPLGEGTGVGMDLGLEGNTRKLGQTGRIGVFGQDWAAVERWKLAWVECCRKVFFLVLGGK